MLINNNPSLLGRLKPFCLQVKPFAQTKLRINDSEFSKYQECSLLKSRPNEVLDYYMALSVEALRFTSNEFHKNGCVKYDRSISGQEELVYNLLDKSIRIPCIRQLLIGGKSSDFYIPSIHICSEPEGDRFASTSKRSKAREYADKERWFMNNLHSISIEDYQGKRLYYIVEELRRTRLITEPLEMKSNMFIMAVRTLPRFIPYKEFILLMEKGYTPYLQ